MRIRPLNSDSKPAMAFSLLEVMVAVAIFFMCIFSILGLVSRSLRQARELRPVEADAKSAITLLSLTNRLEEGVLPPEIVEAFERQNPGYTIAGQIYEVATNGLFRIDFTVGGASSGERKIAVTSDTSILLFRPLSGGTRFGGRGPIRR
jgi:Tfp pilus assembly protein PilV